MKKDIERIFGNYGRLYRVKKKISRKKTQPNIISNDVRFYFKEI